MSTRMTSKPDRAATCAMPCPMVPAPTTPMVRVDGMDMNGSPVMRSGAVGRPASISPAAAAGRSELEVLPPHLEGDDRPQHVGMVGARRQVLLHDGGDVARMEVPLAAQSSLVEIVSQKPLQRAAQPVAHGHAEPLLGTGADASGQVPLQEAARQVLLDRPLQL